VLYPSDEPGELLQWQCHDDSSTNVVVHCYYYCWCCGGTGAAVTDEPGVIGYCYALYDYLALEPNQLSLRRGDRVAVVSKAGASRGWWKGRLRGKVRTLYTGVGVPAALKFLKLQSCPEIVLKFEIVPKSQSFSINVLILTIVVRAQ